MQLAEPMTDDRGHLSRRSARYSRPSDVVASELDELLALKGREALDLPQAELQISVRDQPRRSGITVFSAGDLALLKRPCVSVVGTRDVSSAGELRASRLARELAEAGIVVVSGLAKGIDTVALASAIKHNGRVAGVIGTPLSKAYPAENSSLQGLIWRQHLLVTPFAEGEVVYKSNFPKRNRIMAALSDATVIVEASDTSGTLHQAAECQRLGRWLFIMKSVVEDLRLTWPQSFLGKPKTAILERTEDVVEAIRG